MVTVFDQHDHLSGIASSSAEACAEGQSFTALSLKDRITKLFWNYPEG